MGKIKTLHCITNGMQMMDYQGMVTSLSPLKNGCRTPNAGVGGFYGHFSWPTRNEKSHNVAISLSPSI